MRYIAMLPGSRLPHRRRLAAGKAEGRRFDPAPGHLFKQASRLVTVRLRRSWPLDGWPWL